jgi:hypothetical protein
MPHYDKGKARFKKGRNTQEELCLSVANNK